MIASPSSNASGAEHARTLAYAPRAQKDLAKLPADVQRQVVAALVRFATTGYGDVRKLTDSKPPEYRLRIGDWRARLTLTATSVQVEHILNRRDAY